MRNRRPPEYYAWRQMIQRCTNPRNASWHRYGGRGITVCLKWRESFRAFYEDMGPRPPGMTLERTDNNKDYSPRNCKWGTRIEQARNRRSNIRLTFKGETHCLMDWAEKLWFTYPTLYWRHVLRGWPVAKTLSTPSRWAPR